MTDRQAASGRRGCEVLGDYVDAAGDSHRVQVQERGDMSWEILDAPETGEPVVIERLEGELESAQTAEAVERDYLTLARNLLGPAGRRSSGR